MAAIEHWYEITCEDLTLLYHFHIDVIFYVLLPFLKQKKNSHSNQFNSIDQRPWIISTNISIVLKCYATMSNSVNEGIGAKVEQIFLPNHQWRLGFFIKKWRIDQIVNGT